MSENLRPLRAEGHRDFIGPEFGSTINPRDDNPTGLNYFQILADPKLAHLGRQVFDQLKTQFQSDGIVKETSEEEAYRIRLESWADALEVMLEEVLEELATLKSGRGTQADGQPVLL